MAKYRLENNNYKVDCELLNESNGQYIVKFRSGVIRSVDKDRVSDFDMIDEGVLDAIGAGIEKVGVVANKYGRKIADTANRAYNAIVDFFVKVFVKGNQIVFGDPETNMVLPAVTPATTILNRERLGNKGVNFIPGTTVREIAKEAGITPSAFVGFEYDNSPFDGDEFIGSYEVVVNESYNSNDVLEQLYEVNLPVHTSRTSWLGNKEKITIVSPTDGKNNPLITDFNLKDITQYIYIDYKERFNGNEEYSAPPLLMFGAPGIGKTAITKMLRDMIESRITHGEQINLYSVDAASMSSESFTNPTIIDDSGNWESGNVFPNQKDSSTFVDYADELVKRQNEFRKNNQIDALRVSRKLFGTKKIMDMPKTWLPVYDTTGATREEIYYLNIIANGGKIDQDPSSGEIKVIKEGVGGIFFIDEYSRMSFEGKQVFMGVPIDRKLASNLKFGSKWTFVAAANRKADMSSKGIDEFMDIEAATRTRWAYCNYVPEPKDWYTWAELPSKTNSKRKNVAPEIIDYIKTSIIEHPDYGDYYEVYYDKASSESPKDYDFRKAAATPRGWKGVSDLLYSLTEGYNEEENKNLSISSFIQEMNEDVDENVPNARQVNNDRKETILRIDKFISAIVGSNPSYRFLDYITKIPISSTEIDSLIYAPIGIKELAKDDLAKRTEQLINSFLSTRGPNAVSTRIKSVDLGTLSADDLIDTNSKTNREILNSILNASQVKENIIENNGTTNDDYMRKANTLISVYYVIALISSRCDGQGGFNGDVYDILSDEFNKSVGFNLKKKYNNPLDGAIVAKGLIKDKAA